MEGSEKVEAVEAVEKQREEEEATDRAIEGEMEGSGEESLVNGGESDKS